MANAIRKPVASRPQGRGSAPTFYPGPKKMKMPSVMPMGEAPKMEMPMSGMMDMMGPGHMMPVYSPSITVAPPIFNFPGSGQGGAPAYSPSGMGMGNMSAPAYAPEPEEMKRKRTGRSAPKMSAAPMM